MEYWKVVKNATINPRQNKSSQSRQCQTFVFLLWGSHLTILLFNPFISRSLPLPPSNVAKFWDTHSFMQRYWYVYSAALLGGGRKYVVQKQTWICENCWIICCEMGFFTELCPYQNIFVYLLLSRIEDISGTQK